MSRWWLIVGGVSGVAFAACVGDAPVGTGPDAATPADGSTIPDTGAGDSASPMDAGSPCLEAGPNPFGPPPPGLGPFCGKGNGVDGGKNCALGDVCCVTQGSSNTCSSTCPGTSASIACNGNAECIQADAGAVCCADGTLDTTTCSYPVFKTLQRSRCLPSCATGQTQLCEGNGDCAPLSCVGATTPLFGYGVSVCR